jgi:Xaa-Pro aminopeptidase
MENKPRIPDEEFRQRAISVQKLMVEQDIDMLLAFGNEAEPQFARYLCDYWPSFETCGVLVAQTGDPVLLIGPESATFAKDRSRIADIHRLAAFRESSNPEYPGEALETIDQVMDGMECGTAIQRFAIAGYNLIPHVTVEELRKAFTRYGNIQIVRGDELMMRLRMVKSDNEIACMRYASNITAMAFDYTLEHIKPGMTELQVRGLACASLYEHGAENEAFPMWVLTGEGSNQAISRARQKTIVREDMVQLQIGARFEGYASSIGRPVFFGTPEPYLLDAVKAGYAAHEAVCEQLYAGNNAAAVAHAYDVIMGQTGHRGWLLYGPCHATGLMEGEPPWIESNSDYLLYKNMTYCVDIYMGCNKTGRGFRIEDSVRVGETCADNMTNYRKEIFVL